MALINGSLIKASHIHIQILHRIYYSTYLYIRISSGHSILEHISLHKAMEQYLLYNPENLCQTNNEAQQKRDIKTCRGS